MIYENMYNVSDKDMYSVSELTIYPDCSNISRKTVEDIKYIHNNFGKIKELRIGEEIEIRGSFVASNVQLLKTTVVKIRRIL